MQKTFLFLLLILCVVLSSAYVNSQKENQKPKIPSWAENVFISNKLNELYDFFFKINPYYLEGDFNGDKKMDVAVLIQEKKSSKRGILIIHAGKNEIIIVGAGKGFDGNEKEDDLYWIDAWAVHPKGPVDKGITQDGAPVLKGDALFLEKSEDGMGILYWDGKSYHFYAQGC